MHERSLILHYLSDGQYMASRLSRGINQETAKLKQLVSKFNTIPGGRNITWVEATDLSSSTFHQRTSTVIPRNIRLTAIKHHHLALRADADEDI